MTDGEQKSVRATVTIERLGAQGDGLATHDGRRLIVPFALPGEIVDIRISGRRGDADIAGLIAIVQPSGQRATPACPHFGACGGCALQHAEPGLVSDWRQTVIAEALARAGLDVAVAAPIRAGDIGRRRARWAALKPHRGKLVLGYHRRRGRQVVDIAACPLIADTLSILIDPLRAVLDVVLSAGEAADVAVTAAENGVDLLLVGPKDLGMDARLALAALAERHDMARISWTPDDREAPEPVALRRMPVVRFGGHRVPVPPGAFLQATAAGEAAMVAFACQALAGARHVADLYAGCGAFALPLTEQARVSAYESAPEMADALDQAARTAQLSGRLTVVRRDLERRPLQRDELKRLDGVVLDPPRAGAAHQCATLAESRVPVVVMASCYPPTFARDARTLVDGGYRLTAVQPVDQFGWSHHVELISRFDR